VSSSAMRVGIVGCGVVSRFYAQNAPAFESFQLVACADLDTRAAELLAAEHGLVVAPVDDLIADPAVDIVLNLTPPEAHLTVIRQALRAGKHVYSEKPLATTAADAAKLVADADRRGLRIGCAPDTFLGAPYRAARRLIDAGAIGEPLSVSAAMLAGSQAIWHPNPDIFFADGAGPLLDMGPYYLTAIVSLLGPVRRVAGFASTRVLERTIEIGPRVGERFKAETPTHIAAVLELDGGATANLVASFEAGDQYVSELEIHGSEGVLALPDPNAFDGPVRMRRGRSGWEDVPFTSRGDQEARGLGLHDLVEALAEGRPHRASGQLAHHVVDVGRSVLAAAAKGRTLDVRTHAERPAPMPEAGQAPRAGGTRVRTPR
jgi:predicted dehydrogenase